MDPQTLAEVLSTRPCSISKECTGPGWPSYVSYQTVIQCSDSVMLCMARAQSLHNRALGVRRADWIEMASICRVSLSKCADQ